MAQYTKPNIVRKSRHRIEWLRSAAVTACKTVSFSLVCDKALTKFTESAGQSMDAVDRVWAENVNLFFDH